MCVGQTRLDQSIMFPVLPGEVRRTQNNCGLVKEAVPGPLSCDTHVRVNLCIFLHIQILSG